MVAKEDGYGYLAAYPAAIHYEEARLARCVLKRIGCGIIFLFCVIHRTDGGRRGFADDADHMRVRLMCHCRRSVAEKGGNLVHGNLLVEKRGRCGVPGVMEPYASYTRPVTELGPSVRDVIGSDVFLLNVHEHGVLRCRLRVHGESTSFETLPVAVASERIKYPWVNSDPPYLARLCAVEDVRADTVVHECLLEGHDPRFKVNMPPVETERFSSPATDRQKKSP